MGARASGFEGRRFGSSGGPTTLGPERQGAHGISIRPWKYGQEPLLDVISRRRLLQPATGCDGCRAGDAPAGARAGNLKTTPQQTVTTQGSTIVVQPANPEVVYVPAYDPWMVYGDPIMAWPGWYPYPGIWFGGPYLSFRNGFWNRLLRRFWMGLESLGIQLAWPITQLMAAAGTTPGATRFITGAVSTEAEAARGGAAASAATRGGSFPTVPAQRPGLSTETARRLEDTLHPAVRAASARAPSAAIEKGGQAKSYSSRGSASFGGGGVRGGGGGSHGGGGGGSHGGGGGHH